MKRRIAVSFLILIVAIICCGCGSATSSNTISNNSHIYQSRYEDEYEHDITYKKDENDHTPTVYITKSGKRYHRFGCSHAKNLYIVLTVSQAIDMGYTACYFCCY